MAKDTGSTYVKNVCWTISGQGMTTYNSGTFDCPTFNSASSYAATSISWNDAWVYNGNLCCLDWDLVDDSSGHDENIHHIYVYQGSTSGNLLWETSEHWNTNGHCYEALDDGDITKRNTINSTSASLTTAFTDWSDKLFEIRNETLCIKFVFESGDYAIHYVTAPWKWRLPANSKISLVSGFTRSIYKNQTYSAGTGSVKAYLSRWSTYNPEYSGRVYYEYTLPSSYYSLSSIDTSTAGIKTVTISSGFRCSNGGATRTDSYTVTVYGISSYNIGILRNVESGNRLKYPVTNTNISYYLPEQATITYDNGTVQTVTISTSYLSGNYDLTSYGTKNFRITIPASVTHTNEAVYADYSIDVYIDTSDVSNAVRWRSTYNNVTKDIVAIKNEGASKYFWVKPTEVTLSGIKNYQDSKLRLYSSPYYGESAKDLKEANSPYILHYGDVITGTLKATKYWTEYNPSSSISKPTLVSKTKTTLQLTNSNNFSVDVYKNNSKVTTANANSNYTLTGLTGGTSYSIGHRKAYSWDNYSKTYSGPTNTVLTNVTNYKQTITGTNTTSRTGGGSGTLNSGNTSFSTSPKTALESVSSNGWLYTRYLRINLNAVGPVYPCQYVISGDYSTTISLNDGEGWFFDVSRNNKWGSDKTVYIQHVPTSSQEAEYTSSSRISYNVPKGDFS